MQFKPIFFKDQPWFIKYENLNTTGMLMKKIIETICASDSYRFLSNKKKITSMFIQICI